MDIFTLLIGVLAYIIGAIPTGYIIAKCKGIDDIRKHGSGNIGATNVSRMLGKKYFFLIFFIDALKAYFFIYFIKDYNIAMNHLYIFATIFLIGNGCSIFLRGSGGKGGATACGLLVALNTKIACIIFGIWCLLLSITQTVGIASVGAAIWLPFCAYATHNPPFFLFSLFATLWVIHKHQSNIRAYLK